MIRNISDSVVIPIAGIIITLILCYELISMLTERNNLHDVDTWMFFKYFVKMWIAVYLVSHVQILLTALFGVILLRRDSVRSRGEQIDLMQSLPLANIHQGFLKVLQIVFGKVVLVASLAVDGPFGEWLRVNIKFAQTVDYDMGVNVGRSNHVHTEATGIYRPAYWRNEEETDKVFPGCL